MLNKFLLAGTFLMTLPASVLADEPTHQAWNDLLADYVQVSEDGINRFDYGGLKANAADREKLQTYIASFAFQCSAT